MQEKNNQRDQLLAQALQKSRANPSYLEFFGLRRPPFDRISDLAGVFHTEQYTLLLDHLSNAAVQSDYLVAICGADGCGKTTLLNKFLFSLGEDVCVARVDESYRGVREFYCEFLRQLGFHDIDGKPDELRRITREFVVNRGMASEPVMLVIDNAHLISPFILEQLRWLSAIKVDGVRVLSCVLAGNSDLMRIMDSTAMSQFAFNNYIRFHIRVFSEAETMDYVRSRLKFAGCSDRLIISSDAQPLIHRFSGGIPRLINILCDAVLQDACAQGVTKVTDEMLRNVADNRHLVPHVLPYQGKGRRRSDPDFSISDPVANTRDALTSADNKCVGDPDGENRGHRESVDDLHRLTAGYDSGLRQQIKRLSSKLSELKGENNRLSINIASRDAEIGELRSALQCQAAKNAELQQAYGDQSGAYEQLNKSLLDQVTARERSDETNRHLVEALRKDQQELTELRKELANASRECEDLVNLRLESEQLRLQLANAERNEETIARLEHEAIDLRRQVDAGSNNEKTIARLSKELDDVHARLADATCDRDVMAKLQVEVQELCDELNAGDGVVSQLQAEISDALEAIGYFETELASANLAASELQEEVRAGEHRYSKQTARVLDLEAVVDAHDQEVAALQCRIDELETERLATSDQLSQLASLEAYTSDCEAQIAALESKLESAQDQRQDFAHLADSDMNCATGSFFPNAAEVTASETSSVPIRTIEVFRGDELLRILRLETDQKRVMIGRDSDNELVLDSSFISRHHAILSFRDDGHACIEDLNSLNGIVVNKKKMARSDLYVGDIVILGDFCLLPGPA